MLQTIKTPAIDLDNLRQAIQDEYDLVANEPEHGFHCLVGRPLAQLLGYQEEWLLGVPEPTIASFAGTRNPFSAGPLQSGEHVVDVGCGGGIDSLIAANIVGPAGRVVGVDMTSAMLAKAFASATAAGITNVEFREGFGEALPVEDGWADLVISNGVLNLMSDKDAALREMARVLKPGGRLQIGDVLVQKPVPQSAKEDIALWTGWIAGALLEGEIALAVTAAGFVGFEIQSRTDVYAGAEQSSSAANFGTLGITFRSRKASSDEEWQEAMAALSCDLEATGGN